ncbi:MAG TPA: Crp/Fnr family transcriptional regulator [Terriglobales bacterium]|nr:Crp/Fnr family transcriptional regulator [Terriglobales bacterium]
MASTNGPPATYKNRVLAGLSPAEIRRLVPHLSRMTFKQGQTLAARNKKIVYAYLLEDGMASVVITMRNGGTVEVGVVGREGVVSLPGIFGTSPMALTTFIQAAGHGFRIDAERLRAEVVRSPSLRRSLEALLHLQILLMAQSAACNRLHEINQRLARWLLTCRERVGSDCLLLKHDFLAQMLGTRRSSVTLAAGALQRKGLIDYSRGKVTIRDLRGLEAAACECYAVVRDEAQRLGIVFGTVVTAA